MSFLDWGIVIVFLGFIIGMGIYSMRYVRGITDFLACGRVCGRYVISVADAANGLALITMIGAVEAVRWPRTYRTCKSKKKPRNPVSQHEITDARTS